MAPAVGLRLPGNGGRQRKTGLVSTEQNGAQRLPSHSVPGPVAFSRSFMKARLKLPGENWGT